MLNSTGIQVKAHQLAGETNGDLIDNFDQLCIVSILCISTFLAKQKQIINS